VSLTSWECECTDRGCGKQVQVPILKGIWYANFGLIIIVDGCKNPLPGGYIFHESKDGYTVYKKRPKARVQWN
jgi:hypothetical protein